MRKEKRRFPHPFASAKPRAMGKQYWLMKSEPHAYSWDDLGRDGSGIWDGVRNHTAKQNMQAMKVGDEALFYHSNIGKECVGIMRIVETAFPDPTADAGSPWVVVRVEPVRPLAHPVSLKRSEEHTSELQSLMRISYAVFCL